MVRFASEKTNHQNRWQHSVAKQKIVSDTEPNLAGSSDWIRPGHDRPLTPATTHDELNRNAGAYFPPATLDPNGPAYWLPSGVFGTTPDRCPPAGILERPSGTKTFRSVPLHFNPSPRLPIGPQCPVEQRPQEPVLQKAKGNISGIYNREKDSMFAKSFERKGKAVRGSRSLERAIPDRKKKKKHQYHHKKWNPGRDWRPVIPVHEGSEPVVNNGKTPRDVYCFR